MIWIVFRPCNAFWVLRSIFLSVCQINCLPYINLPMQYTCTVYFLLKNVNFQIENHDVFLTFALNIDCGYTFTS